MSIQVVNSAIQSGLKHQWLNYVINYVTLTVSVPSMDKGG